MIWLVVPVEIALSAVIFSDELTNEIVRVAAALTAISTISWVLVRWFKKARRGMRWLRDFGRKAMEAAEELGQLAKWREEVDDRLHQGSSRFEDLTQRVGRLEDAITPDLTVRHTFASGPRGEAGPMGPEGAMGPEGPAGGVE